VATRGDRTYRAVAVVALGVLRLLGFRIDVRGTEHIPTEGGAVLAINHVSYFDFVFVGLAARRRGRLVRFLAKQAVFDTPVVGRAMRAMGHIPVDRAAGANAYRHAVAALRAGELVGVFPEATISRSFVPRALKAGAARMALEAGVPLVPVVTWGGHRVWTVGRRPRPTRGVPVEIVVDRPLDLGADATADAATDRLAERLDTLVDEVTATYPGLAEARGAWWVPARLGGGAPTRTAATAGERRAIAGDDRHGDGHDHGHGERHDDDRHDDDRHDDDRHDDDRHDDGHDGQSRRDSHDDG
jgi:1-acyl-sn-glycerol-3-phosphate acyltransferase